MWRDGEGKRAPGPNHWIWGIVMHIGAKCAGPRAMMGLAGLPGGGKPDTGRAADSTASRPVQALGTIEAGSKEVTTASDDEGRSPPRSKSVRRSKALERRNG